MLKLILLIVFVIIFAVLMLPVFILWLFIRDKGNHLVHRITQFMMRNAAKAYMFICGIKITAEGIENIPDGQALYVSNHTGIFDVAAAYACTKPLLSFIGKKEAKGIPVIGQVMAMMNGLFLDRGDLKQGLQVILKAIDNIKNGLNVWVCPEGTREKSGAPEELLPFHAGCFKIALKSDAPIVPVVIIGSRALFEEHKPWISSGRLKIRYGKPVYPKELTDEERRHIGEYFRNKMIEMIKEDK